MEHVDFLPSLGKGTDDVSIAEYSLEADRLIVTYDDDFVLKIDEQNYRAVLYINGVSLSVKTVADIVHSVSEHYPQEEIQGLVYLGSEWL